MKVVDNKATFTAKVKRILLEKINEDDLKDKPHMFR